MVKKNSKFVMQVTSDQFSDKFNNGWKKVRMADLLRFSHFTSIIWPCWCDNMNSFPFILLKFVMHGTNKQFSDNFDRTSKKFKWPLYCDFLHFTSEILLVGFVSGIDPLYLGNRLLNCFHITWIHTSSGGVDVPFEFMTFEFIFDLQLCGHYWL